MNLKKQSVGQVIRYRIREPLVKILLRGFALLPLWLNHRIGTLLGLALYRFSGEMRFLALRNLELCFPEMNPEARVTLAREALIEVGKGMTEMSPVWLWSVDKVNSLVTVSGMEQLDLALARGKGVVLITPHIGSWEVASCYIPSHYAMTNMYRPHPIESLDNLMRYGRSKSGATLAPTDASGVRRLLQALKKGEIVGMLPDQDPAWGAGEFVPFFNIPTYTVTLVAKLASKTGAALLACYVKRLPDGKGYELVFKPVNEPVAGSSDYEYLVAVNQCVEAMIRECPAQYQWAYRRFRKRPNGEPNLYER